MYASQGFQEKKLKFVDKQAYLLIKENIFRVLSDEFGGFIERKIRYFQ